MNYRDSVPATTPEARVEALAEALQRPATRERPYRPRLDLRKLSDAQRDAIRALRPTHKLLELAEAFGVSRAAIQVICRGVKGPHTMGPTPWTAAELEMVAAVK